MSHQAAITAGQREAGDSLDFHVRHGRALHARAAREGLAALLTMLRASRRQRRLSTRRGGARGVAGRAAGEPLRPAVMNRSNVAQERTTRSRPVGWKSTVGSAVRSMRCMNEPAALPT